VRALASLTLSEAHGPDLPALPLLLVASIVAERGHRPRG
jgi:hypothetical protein